MSVSGFPRNWFVGSVPDDLGVTCNLCKDVPCDPIQCNQGHIFCNSCVCKEFKLCRVCPSCSIVGNRSETSFQRNLVAKNVIKVLQVKCHNNVNCNWRGIVDDRKGHACAFRPFKCPNKGCSYVLNAFTQLEHKAVCSRRCVSCDQCGNSFAFDSLAFHARLCPERPVRCKCGMTLPACLITQHKSGECSYVHPASSLKHKQPPTESTSVSSVGTDSVTDNASVSDSVSISPVVRCKCGEHVHTAHIVSHQAKDCQMTFVECPLYQLGQCEATCTGSVVKYKLLSHLHIDSAPAAPLSQHNSPGVIHGDHRETIDRISALRKHWAQGRKRCVENAESMVDDEEKEEEEEYCFDA